jgi:glycosyltransferase involved in cell wall biosynthesis
LRSSHLMLLPSEHENFGIVVLEALSRRVQVLLSPEVGLTEELRSSNNVTVQPIDEELWGRSIRKKLELFKLAKNDAKKAFVHDWGAERFNWQQIGRNWCRNYAELVERQRGRESKA